MGSTKFDQDQFQCAQAADERTFLDGCGTSSLGDGLMLKRSQSFYNFNGR